MQYNNRCYSVELHLVLYMQLKMNLSTTSQHKFDISRFINVSGSILFCDHNFERYKS